MARPQDLHEVRSFHLQSAQGVTQSATTASASRAVDQVFGEGSDRALTAVQLLLGLPSRIVALDLLLRLTEISRTNGSKEGPGPMPPSMASPLLLEAVMKPLVQILQADETWRDEMDKYVQLGNIPALSDIMCATMAQMERMRVMTFLANQVRDRGRNPLMKPRAP